ncbi:hypothetical protein [Synechococcus sp. MEDNS5]|uniref:hypothetical protein n=1 Tax=Synechococcus sp. MEDNS5 TaxID=1442554 RepID=UPI0016489A64|nr:hypothetical protein [Synechococcus sp. MEDNS5]
MCRWSRPEPDVSGGGDHLADSILKVTAIDRAGSGEAGLQLLQLERCRLREYNRTEML